MRINNMMDLGVLVSFTVLALSMELRYGDKFAAWNNRHGKA